MQQYLYFVAFGIVALLLVFVLVSLVSIQGTSKSIRNLLDQTFVRLVLDSPKAAGVEEEDNFSKAEAIVPSGNHHEEEQADIIDSIPALKETPVAVATSPKTRPKAKRKVNKKKDGSKK